VALDSALDGGAVGAFGEVHALGVDAAGQGGGGDGKSSLAPCLRTKLSAYVFAKVVEISVISC
jgi:hypothetical protein